ncbi:ATP-binding cassette domain-containing protein [Nakamurella sp. YIM 132087]|uniref:ATP-binding cassette domain-containing protein n=1 Tax=Nakamurella alba TaxID=2665158 RepID=A0A7K1FSC6_9ACTN|nr:ABC transporter ATP-binding protein [Nakamurella alba]MTD15734.1 ATP-binding cassette domain-containing protein [Nakamurella alba]
MSADLLPIATSREAGRMAWAALAGRRGTLVVALLMFALSGLAGVVAPLAFGEIVNAVTDSAADAAGVVWWSAAAVVIAAAVEFVATTASVTYLARAGQPALAQIREDVLDRALHLDHQRVERAGAGDLLSRVGDDVRVLSESLNEVFPLLMRSVVAIVFTGAGMFALDWRLGLAGLAALPFYVFGLRWYLPRSGPFYRAERVANGERAEALVTAIHGSGTLRAYGLGSRHAARVADTSWRAASLTLRVWDLLNRFGQRSNRSELIGLLLILGTGFFAVRGDLGAPATVGAVTAAALLFHRLFNPIGVVLMVFDEVQSAGASLTRLAGVATLPPAPVPDGVVTPGAPAVRLDGIGHAYVEDRWVLEDVTLDVGPGQRVAVVGTTGAGKSTLGQIVAGRIVPTAGGITVGDRPLAEVLAHRGESLPVALVTQETHVFAGTVRDNLTLAAPTADDERLWAVLDRLGAAGWVRGLGAGDRSGLDHHIGDGGSLLTPAQAQHLALARVDLAAPGVVVLDEATAEAGSAGARQLERAAGLVTDGRTTLTIAHRLTQAETADRVLVMEHGRVIESGTHAELLDLDGVYASLWSAWKS